MATRIAIDVDLTIVNELGELRAGVYEGLSALKQKEYLLTLWSSAGKEYARQMARKNEIDEFFDDFADKPDLVIDDQPEEISQLPAVDARSSKSWTHTSSTAIRLAEELDMGNQWPHLPMWLKFLARDRYSVGVQGVVALWRRRDAYVRWPREKRVLSEEWVRHPDGKKKDCYKFPPHLVAEITKAGLPLDRRNNGPAILSFLLAGGDRPLRPYPSRWGWTIHHIYDGQHPNPRFPKKPVPHAASDSRMFTDSRGLAALHPIADYFAMNEPLLAWLLRWEAFRRFDFDPMRVFD